MLFTWHPGLGAHIVRQYLSTWVFVAAGIAIALVYAFPFALQFIVYPYHIPDLWLHFHNVVIIFSMFTSVVSMECYRILKTKDVDLLSPQHIRIKGVVSDLANRASLRLVPRVSMSISERWLRPVVIQHTFSRSEIILNTNVIEILDEREMDAVLAHEIAHVKHCDMPLRTFFVASMVVFTSYVFIAATVGITALYLDLPSILVGYIATKATYLAAFWYVLIRLLFFVYSRACEYLADAAIVKITDWSYREDLIRALLKIEKHAGYLPLLRELLLRFNLHEFFSTHPLTKNRAKGLGLRIELFPFGFKRIVDEKKPL